LSRPELAINVLEQSACVACRFFPRCFVVGQVLALVVGAGSNIVNVKEGKRDFLRTVTPALLTDGLRIEGGI
jgi:hypothetical protein